MQETLLEKDLIANLKNDVRFSFDECDYKKINRPEVLSKIDYQTLEIDADSWAINILVQETNYWIENNPNDVYSDFYSDKGLAIFTLIFSIFSLFNIMNINPVNANDIKKMSHPPEGSRQHNMSALISTMYHKSSEEEILEQLPTIIRSAISECKKSFDEISEFGFNKAPFNSAYSQDVMNHFINISNNWEHLYERLSPLSYNNIAPFEKVDYLDLNKFAFIQ